MEKLNENNCCLDKSNLINNKTPMVHIISFAFDEKNFADLGFQIRRKVFVDEQRVNRHDEYDHFEKTAQHYLAFAEHQPVGAARWRETAHGIKLERFAVLKEYRNKGIGTMLLKKIIRDTHSMNRKIYLHAQLSAVNFYKKEGFKVVGEIFSEANIQHYKMELDV
jgi:predicted GNAT family N-acyltransferase